MSHRLRASLIHLLISMFLVSGILTAVALVWYPRPYFEAMGIARIMLILAGVDICIGPLMTLIVFNQYKPSLKFDLSFIALLQCAAMLYGCSIVFEGRPLYVVYNLDRFTIVAKSDIPAEEVKRAGDRASSIGGPEIVGARLPKDREELKRILFSSVGGGADLAQMPAYYLPYEQVAAEVKEKILDLDLLTRRQSAASAAAAHASIATALAAAGLSAAEVGFIPLRAKVHDLSVLVRRRDAAIITILPLDPWGS
jgi:hypothetical protein